MENDIAAVAAGYVGMRLGIITICAYWLFKLATFRKPVEVTVSSEKIDHDDARIGQS